MSDVVLIGLLGPLRTTSSPKASIGQLASQD
jgi:hypothetical protein